ncbi:MAG: putative two-component system response regulator [Planctomycetota bacterium]|jgi:putative two-component system response regulator
MKRILFVDDERNLLAGLARLLRDMRREWDMDFATSAEKALEFLQASDYDAVISDINMPIMDGFDLLRQIRADERTADIPVVILTGNAERSLKRRALDLGATDLLNKPADREELVARIKSVLRLKAYQDRIKLDKDTLEIRVRERTAELERSRIEMIWRLGKAGEFRDSDTGNHVVRVGYYSLELANTLGLDRAFARRLFITAPLHDIGKIGTPDSILLKPGKLTPDEWIIMKQHTLIGAEILKNNMIGSRQSEVLGEIFSSSSGGALPEGGHLTEMSASIALNHHERWDGGGYPSGLIGEEIPVEARITTLADVYDALSSKRPYKKAFPEDEVFSIMREGVGTQFDPEAFAAFERSKAAFREIASELADDVEIQADIGAALEDQEAA